jgi:hypothetical protein
VQPVPGAQASVVQGLLSSHATIADPWHVPAAQRSSLVHASPSSQGLALFAWTHDPATHASSVHGLLSSQLDGHWEVASIVSLVASMRTSRCASRATSLDASDRASIVIESVAGRAS